MNFKTRIGRDEREYSHEEIKKLYSEGLVNSTTPISFNGRDWSTIGKHPFLSKVVADTQQVTEEAGYYLKGKLSGHYTLSQIKTMWADKTIEENMLISMFPDKDFLPLQYHPTAWAALKVGAKHKLATERTFEKINDNKAPKVDVLDMLKANEAHLQAAEGQYVEPVVVRKERRFTVIPDFGNWDFEVKLLITWVVTFLIGRYALSFTITAENLESAALFSLIKSTIYTFLFYLEIPIVIVLSSGTESLRKKLATTAIVLGATGVLYVSLLRQASYISYFDEVTTGKATMTSQHYASLAKLDIREYMVKPCIINSDGMLELIPRNATGIGGNKIAVVSTEALYKYDAKLAWTLVKEARKNYIKKRLSLGYNMDDEDFYTATELALKIGWADKGTTPVVSKWDSAITAARLEMEEALRKEQK